MLTTWFEQVVMGKSEKMSTPSRNNRALSTKKGSPEDSTDATFWSLKTRNWWGLTSAFPQRVSGSPWVCGVQPAADGNTCCRKCCPHRVCEIPHSGNGLALWRKSKKPLSSYRPAAWETAWCFQKKKLKQRWNYSDTPEPPRGHGDNITFHRVHHLGSKWPGGYRPKPFVAKFRYFKQKDNKKSWWRIGGQELRGMDLTVCELTALPRPEYHSISVLTPFSESSLLSFSMC